MGAEEVKTNYITRQVQIGETDSQIEAQITKLRQIQSKNRRYAEKIIQSIKQKNRRVEYHQQERTAFKNYIENLDNLDLQSKIPTYIRENGFGYYGKRLSSLRQKHYAVIGPISSGKSSFLNSIFNIRQSVGLGQTTMKARPVYKDPIKRLVVWDVPGINKDFSIYKPQNLSFFAGCNKIFVLYRDSPKRCDKIIKVLHKINPKLILIRTQCDRWDSQQQRTLNQQKYEDKKIVLNWGISRVSFYQHSAFKFGFDNQIINQLISS